MIGDEDLQKKKGRGQQYLLCNKFGDKTLTELGLAPSQSWHSTKVAYPGERSGNGFLPQLFGTILDWPCFEKRFPVIIDLGNNDISVPNVSHTR